MKKLFKSEAGISLVQVMIAGALVAGLGVVLMNFVDIGNKSQAGMVNSAAFEIYKQNVLRIISGPDCTNAFRKADGTRATFGKNLPATLKEIRKKVKTQDILIAKVGKKESGFTLTDLNLSYMVDVAGNEIDPEVNSPSPGLTTHHASFYLVASKDGSGYGAKQFSTQKYPVHLTLVTNSGNNEIIGCAAVPTAAPSQCKMVKGVAQTQNNASVPVVFPAPFTNVPTVVASPRAGAPVGITNVTKTGFEAAGQTYNYMYDYDWIAFDSDCFAP